jgi:hypothetical protein
MESEPSLFQFEIGMADLAMGVTACVNFWRSLAVFLLGDAVGHEADDCGQFRLGKRRRSVLRRYRLPLARDHSPDHRSSVRGGDAHLLKASQKTVPRKCR